MTDVVVYNIVVKFCITISNLPPFEYQFYSNIAMMTIHKACKNFATWIILITLLSFDYKKNKKKSMVITILLDD